MPMDASGKIRTQDMLKLTPMKLDARRAFIKSSKGKLGGIVINTPAENLLPGYQKRPSQILESMQCGCRKVWKWKDIEKNL
jgi:hypothetical protein